MKRLAFRVIFIGLCLLVFSPLNLPASVAGRISGTVKDSSGAVVPGVTVIAVNADTGTQRQTVTDGQGFYSIPDLPIGRYDVSFERAGFKRFSSVGVCFGH